MAPVMPIIRLKRLAQTEGLAFLNLNISLGGPILVLLSPFLSITKHPDRSTMEALANVDFFYLQRTLYSAPRKLPSLHRALAAKARSI